MQKKIIFMNICNYKNIHNCPKFFVLTMITCSFNVEVQCVLDMCEICEIHSIL